MGRIKTKLVKRITADLIKEHGNELKTDFKKNKEIINKLIEVQSKKIKNTIAGYVTKNIKAQKQ